ncbi:MAG: hypothetical protein A3J30_03680 [Candidatus Wildermuthbacteria bacterium RIFCSPLOWO2_02_FULL_47_9c]|uniref:RNA polymerase, sigma-24 subunit, ECF subfamily n=2 Tax=Parcubacteria group TaxID=1794811 RepID=A0A837INC5_9BACT|nr:MAG: RNA polymerase, sigma-24 subunit, ECF subfamily [Candidatus Yanofskybacteria bacterium GW2011_GWC1_48_11]KKW04070.1 MAG: RNA polymerase, sigma-24 subunit, ECF subfamily [Parcubacteria group bacterium GW2011_GWB1_49_12]KKW08828.1 MAG: RNA polymerase, sigma-24 subunit, ECF subfamily [Parcubacteria group bacterium GW2011_GWA1_49_26]KKW13856.1 MAG: RNA polymerase, sigma-24 subunit, ECF subfamily [Parcubacteria group bacterium GW2011_GWA2_50_10]OHA61754.1 MAG: hypothetical protein A2109_0018
MSEQFGKIYDQYVEKIYRFIFLKVESQEVAEDLCSEVFVCCLEEFQKNSIENTQAFLYQVARYTIADYYRKRAGVKVVSIDEADDIFEEKPTQLQEAAVAAEMEEVRKALARLRDEYQNFIIWRYLDELSIPEIVQITGKTEGNVRVGIHRALGALREEMKERANVQV